MKCQPNIWTISHYKRRKHRVTHVNHNIWVNKTLQKCTIIVERFSIQVDFPALLVSFFTLFLSLSTDSVQYRSDNWRVTQSILTKYNQLGMMMTDTKKTSAKIESVSLFCCGLVNVTTTTRVQLKYFSCFNFQAVFNGNNIELLISEVFRSKG